MPSKRANVGLTIGALCVGGIVLLAVANWQAVIWSILILTAERRPALLEDAAWDDPVSAQRFNNRFHSGVPESELSSWLKQNTFTIDAPGRASRSIASMPCNEVVEIAWSARSDGTIATASVQVHEAGCF